MARKLSPKIKAGIRRRVRILSVVLLVFVALQLIPFEWLGGSASFGRGDLNLWRPSDDRLPIVYSPGYNISLWGLEKLHPFDSKKYEHVFEKLRERFGWTEKDYISPK